MSEPVAYVDPIWINRPDLVMSHQLEIGKLFARTQFTNYVPLYTHPVKEQDTDCQYCKQGCIRCDARKQLTDEEIEEVFCSLDYGHSLNELARALLRKAQEK